MIASSQRTVRAEDLRHIVECIQMGQCCSVVGLSNMGKTFLLKALLTDDIREACRREGSEPPLFVFLDCVQCANSEQSFYNLLLQSAIDELKIQSTLPIRRIVQELEGSSLSTQAVGLLSSFQSEIVRGTGEAAIRSLFTRSIQEIRRQTEGQIVMIFDAFDDVFRALPAWSLRQLWALRESMGIKLSYITATTHILGQLRSDTEVNDFREMFHGHTILLRPLPSPEAISLIENGTALGLVESDAVDISFVVDISGGHPGLINHVCRALKAIPFAERTNPEKCLNRIIQDEMVRNECQVLWEQLTQNEQDELFSWMIESNAETDDIRVQVLEDKGIVIRSGTGPAKIFSPIFEKFALGKMIEKDKNKRWGLWYDPETRLIMLDGRDITGELKGNQLDLIMFLFRNRGVVCTIEEIADAVWPNEVDKIGDFDSRLGELVKRVRKKIEPNPSKPKYIIKVGKGYRLTGPN